MLTRSRARSRQSGASEILVSPVASRSSHGRSSTDSVDHSDDLHHLGSNREDVAVSRRDASAPPEPIQPIQPSPQENREPLQSRHLPSNSSAGDIDYDVFACEMVCTDFCVPFLALSDPIIRRNTGDLSQPIYFHRPTSTTITLDE